MDIEVWKDVVGYEGYYSVSDRGNVRQELDRNGTFKGRMLALNRYDKERYFRVVLVIDKNKKCRTVHSLVAEAFIGPRLSGMQVNHKDSDRYNNNVSNLEYVSARDNVLHAHKNGVSPRGERIANSKMTAEKVRKLREKYVRGVNQFNKGTSYNALSREFGIEKTTVANIFLHRTWKHI